MNKKLFYIPLALENAKSVILNIVKDLLKLARSFTTFRMTNRILRFNGYILVILYAVTAHANIYEHRDNAGNISYSDVPSHNAKLIQPNRMNNITEPEAKETQTFNTPVIQTPVAVKQMYTTFQLMSPSNEQTYQNQRDIPVELKIEPDLQEGDMIQLYVDNLLYGKPEPTTHLQLHQLDRGIHAIYAVIIDANKNIVKKTSTVTIYVHYANLGTKSPS